MQILRRLVDHLEDAKEDIENADENDEFLQKLKNKEFKFQQDGACEFAIWEFNASLRKNCNLYLNSD